MKINYRYISQGEFFVTDNTSTVLVTTGMTECIAISFIDKKNPALRLLAHFDGMILYDENIALLNVTALKNAFTNAGGADFDIYVFGGQKDRRNCKILFATFEKLKLIISKFEDSNIFCANLDALEGLTNFYTPLNANLTMACAPNELPQCLSFSSSKFNNLTDDNLIDGMGLINPEEREQYSRFVKVNGKILRHYPEEAKLLRQCNDMELIKKIENASEKNPLLSLSITRSFKIESSETKKALENNNDDFSAFDYMSVN